MSRYLKYEIASQTATKDYGQIAAINDNNTVNVDINSGATDYAGNPLLLNNVNIRGSYVPKLGDWVAVTWENGYPVVDADMTDNTKDLNNNVLINSDTQISNETITGDHVRLRSLTANNIQTNSLTANEMQTATITAESGVIAEAAITTANIDDLAVTDAKIDTLSANKITGDVEADNITVNVIDAINAHVENLTSAEIEAGVINAEAFQANSIKAINAHIEDLDVTQVDADNISAKALEAETIKAINAHVRNLDVSDVDADNIHSMAIQAEVINAINAHVQNLTSDEIDAGVIDADAMRANVIDAINANIGEAKIDGAQIGEATIGSAQIADLAVEDAHIKSLNAAKINAGDIDTDRLKSNVVDAINLYAGEATIDSAKIDDLDASKITSGIIDTSNVTISTNATGTGARLDFYNDGFYFYDDADNILARMVTGQGFVVHMPSGIKLDSGASIRVGPTEDLVIAGDGIKAKSGSDHYTSFFTGESMRFEDPNNSDEQLRLRAGKLEITKDGGETISTALTANGLYGDIITQYSVTPDKFDTTPPDIPTWRDEGVTSTIKQTPNGSEVATIIIKWNQVSNEDLDGYRIYLKSEDEENFYPVANTGKTDRYEIKGVLPNTTYEVKVSSFDVQGNECDTSTPGNQSLTTYAKSVVTVKDTISPVQPIEEPQVIKGLKSFAIKWNETTTNEDGTECIDLSHYEVQRYSSHTKTWQLIATVKGTSIVDDDIEYDRNYKYRYRPVDTSGNKPDWSPEVDVGVPSRVGNNDIVANSITAEHISTEGFDASVITSGQISGDFIEAETITADKFESSLHGDIVQALRYVESRLSNQVYSWESSDETYNQGTFYNTETYKGTLKLQTVNQWENVRNTVVNNDSQVDWESGTLDSLAVV